MKSAAATYVAPTTLATTLLADAYRDRTNEAHKKEWGQFFTSFPIASFMASLLRAPKRRDVRLLDAGAGTGVLGLAAAQQLITQHGVRVHLVAVEKEPGAIAALREAASDARSRLGADMLSVEIVGDDFLDLDRPRLGIAPLASFDYAIANPPYFKMSPSDDRGGNAPNVYARFMEVAARMLREEGELCFIIPRSFAAGYYFRPFRRRFHGLMRLDHVHVFESRRDAFRIDGVLQENIIVLYRRSRMAEPRVRISCSVGERDLSDRFEHEVDRARVLAPTDASSVVRLPTTESDLRVMDIFASWRDSLDTFGLEVSTGPVVPFREPEHIERAAPEKLLVKNRTYVLLRRFSAKEDARRLVAAPYVRDSIRAPMLGIENHVNFIHRRREVLAETEATALSALLNSQLFDAYFRISSGNTQVSATELRALPLPSTEMLEAVAVRLARGASEEEAVVEVLGEP